MDVNVCVIGGHITKEATTATVGSQGIALTKWSIVNCSGKKTQSFDCLMWGNKGQALVSQLTKDVRVTIVGTLEQNNWTGNDGLTHNNWQLTVTQVNIMETSVPVDLPVF